MISARKSGFIWSLFSSEVFCNEEAELLSSLLFRGEEAGAPSGSCLGAEVRVEVEEERLSFLPRTQLFKPERIPGDASVWNSEGRDEKAAGYI